MKKKKNNFFLIHYPLFIFILIYFIFVAGKIIISQTPFYDWDESIYAQVGREMIRAKSFFVPLWQQVPWLDKPPIPPLLYGLIELLPVPAEISTRLLTLILSCIVLVFYYVLGVRITKSNSISLLTVIITAFIPGFFQRAQSLNVDVFLLLGWLGYVLFYNKLWLSTAFLIVSVLSKSLLGFYPPLLFLLYHTYCLIIKRIDKTGYKILAKKIFIQICISSLWFIGMFVVYGNEFIKYHFVESHFKRVTASIEQHFGVRTFYADILLDQFKWLIVPAIGSLIILVIAFFKKKSDKQILLALFFVPWFMFLNLTKTKIAWYIYPVLPQFAFLASYPLIFIRKKPLILSVSFIGYLLVLFTIINPISPLISGNYSRWEDHHLIALESNKNSCKSLFVLVGENTRTSYATLKSMNLVISTTTWWGNHPSIAYYADMKTTYLYDVKEAINTLSQLKNNSCMIIEKNDLSLFILTQSAQNIVNENNTYLLLKLRPSKVNQI